MLPTEITQVCDRLCGLFMPEDIYVFSIKRRGEEQTVTDFDVCLVMDTPEPNSVIKKAYEEIDSDTAFEIVIYSREQFSHFQLDPSSFASRIVRLGVRYEQKR